MPAADFPGLHILLLPLSAAARGVLLTTRGCGQACRVILRTRSMQREQGYIARFSAPLDWQTLNLSFADFHPRGGVLRRHPRPEALYGYAVQSDTSADFSVARVSFY